MRAGLSRDKLDNHRLATGRNLMLDPQRGNGDSVRDVDRPDDQTDLLAFANLNGIGRKAESAGSDLDLSELLIARRSGRLFR